LYSTEIGKDMAGSRTGGKKPGEVGGITLNRKK
jgi:hypothetical protein